jgi:hypothetical protein
MNTRIKFVKNGDEMLYNPEKRKDTFYQFCQFKNQYSGAFGSRKIIFDEHGTILKIYEREYTAEKIEEFTKHHKINKYKMYPVNDVKYIDLPNGNDMTESRSELLNNGHKIYGNQNVNFD